MHNFLILFYYFIVKFLHPCLPRGVAQWLGRRSLAGGLSLTYALSVVDMWSLCG